MPVFTQIPNNLRVPGAYMEIDNSLAGSSSASKVVLVIAALSAAQEAAGTTTLYQPQRIVSAKDAEDNLGTFNDSEGAQLIKDFLDVNDQLELYALPVPEDYSSVDFVDVWAGLENFGFNWLIYPGQESAQIGAIETELTDRYSATRQIGARCFYFKKDTAANLLSDTRNSPHMVLLPVPASEAKPLNWLARWTAAITKQLAIDPSASLNQIPVKGISTVAQFPFSARNQFLNGGISTWISSKSGQVYVERVITNYTETPEGVSDSSYLDLQIPETLDAMRYYINAELRKKYHDAKLVPDGTEVALGKKAMTPGRMKAFLLSLYQTVFIASKLWCSSLDEYKEGLIAEIDPEDKNRLNYQHDPVLVGRFDVAAGLMRFK